MNQIPNIEETNTREGIEELLERYSEYITPVEIGQYNDKGVNIGFKKLKQVIVEAHHQQLQKAREEEASNIIAEYMEALGTVQLPQEVWLWIADINGKYLNKTLNENI